MTLNRIARLGGTIVVLLLTLAFTLPALAEGRWQKTIDTGCTVWNSSPQPRDIVSWSGSCDASGKASGSGRLQWQFDGKENRQISTYDGEMRGGRYHGRGMETRSNGNRLEGDYVRGKLHGRGVLSRADGDRYEGEFANDKPHGRGVYYFANGHRYEGEFIVGRRHGGGTYIFSEGRSFAGRWREGELMLDSMKWRN